MICPKNKKKNQVSTITKNINYFLFKNSKGIMDGLLKPVLNQIFQSKMSLVVKINN